MINLTFLCILSGVGTYSFPGTTTCNLNILTNIGDGGLFALQVQSYSTYVNAYYGSPAVMGDGSILDTNQQFQYLSSTLQIFHPTSGLCLDDGGNEAQGTSSYSAVLSFTTCNSNSINQQFIITTNYQIYNPNWPNNQVCLNGNGEYYPFFYGYFYGYSSPSYQELILWNCDPNDSNEKFNIVLICSPGIACG